MGQPEADPQASPRVLVPRLQPDQQQTYAQLRGGYLLERLGEVVGDPDLNALSIERGRAILQRTMTRAHDMARREVLAQIPDADLDQRVVPGNGRTAPRPYAQAQC